MDFAVEQLRCRPVFTAALAVAVLLLALPAPGASAATPAVSSATAVSGPPAASTSAAAEGMSIEFTSKVARVGGPGALVQVRCVGSEATSCVGTLAIEAPGEPPEVAFSIDRGEERTVVVPLGSQRDLFDGIVSLKTRVVAQTVQEAGGSVRTARVLRFK